MANFNFDYLNQLEIPTIYLVNPDGVTRLFNLGTIYDRKFELIYNGLSTFTFTAPQNIDGVATDYYNYLEFRRLVYVTGIANFMITDVQIENDGLIELKKITCKSLEVRLAAVQLALWPGDGQLSTFADSFLVPGGVPTHNLMAELLTYVPDWTLGYVSFSLIELTRGIEVTSKSLYDLLMTDISQTYQCIFVFDTVNKTISAYSMDEATQASDIFISFDNLMQSFTINESTSELVTALDVYGGDNVYISYVNPLGSSIIYNFDYYKNTNWMSQSLINTLNGWSGSIVNQSAQYQSYQASYLDLLANPSTGMNTLNSQLVALTTTYNSYVLLRDTRIKQGLVTTDISASMVVVSGSIAVMNARINETTASMVLVSTQIKGIHDALSLDNTANFPPALRSELSNFIIGNAYTDTNFMATDSSSESEILTTASALFLQATAILTKISQPRYTFNITSANFLYIKDFQPFITQLSLGDVITVQLNNNTTGSIVKPALLGYSFSFDDPQDFSLILSNRLRLSDQEFQYTDLFNGTVDSGVTSEFNSQKWSTASDAYFGAIAGSGTLVTSAAAWSGSVAASGSSNLVVFANTKGNMIADAQAMYVPPEAAPMNAALSGGGYTYNYNSIVSTYSIIGRICFFQIYMAIGAVTGGSPGGNVAITYSPPYIPRGPHMVFDAHQENITLTTGYTNLVGRLLTGASSILILQEGSGKPLITISGSSLANGAIYMSGNYFIN